MKILVQQLLFIAAFTKTASYYYWPRLLFSHYFSSRNLPIIGSSFVFPPRPFSSPITAKIKIAIENGSNSSQPMIGIMLRIMVPTMLVMNRSKDWFA
jgi:hypothetical protein